MDEGYEAADLSGRGPNYPEVIQCLLQLQDDRIQQHDMVYLIVDNRDPGEVPYTGLRLKNGGSPVANWSDPIRKKPTSSGSLPINTMGSELSHIIGPVCLSLK